MDRPILPALHPHTATEGTERLVRRLSTDSLQGLAPVVERPTYDRERLRTGVVHLGVGAFHRAHQAVYLDELAQRGVSMDWGIAGVGLRRSNHRTELREQDHLYTVLELSAGTPRARVVGALRDYLSATETPHAVAAALRAPTTQLVTLTITAPSYADGRAVPTFELIANALDDRRRAGTAPFTVVSCDNLPGNGEVTRRRVLTAAQRRGPELVRWIETHVAFPSSMADRITPPASDHDRRLLRQEFGVRDRALVVTEPFRQWVLEDTFSGARPPLEEVGVQLVGDVRPHVEMKMRMLNAAHVALGYLGARTPHGSTDAAMADPVLGPLVERMLAREVQPLLAPVAGADVDAYRASILERLRNPSIADPLCRLRRRGSVRVRNYVLPTLERGLAQGRRCPLLTGVVAAWIDDVRRAARELEAGLATRSEIMERLEDPDADRLLGPALHADQDVRPLLAALDGFEAVREHPAFVDHLQSALTDRERHDRAAS